MVSPLTGPAEEVPQAEPTETNEAPEIQMAKPKRRRRSPSTGWRSLLINRRASIPGFVRHSRKCKICHNHRVVEIEECYINWTSAHWIQEVFRIKSQDSIYRHARAAGLDAVRRQNVRVAVEKLIEEVDHVTVTSATILRAVRALSCLDDKGRWTDPPSTHIVLTAKDSPAQTTMMEAPRRAAADTSAEAANRIEYEKLELDVTHTNQKEDAISNR